jgi:DNA invertase Pin-like site-specific DNA recombinase
MGRAFLYARVSTQKQAERDLSIPDQLAAMRSYAEYRGLEVAGEYIDEGKTGTTERRPAFQRMIEDALAGGASLILVHSLSRLFREHFFMEKYRRKLEEKGVKIASITEDVGDSEIGLFMQQFLSLFGEWQSKENGKHVRRTRLANARQGNFNGGLPPYGYKAEKVGDFGDRTRKKLVIDQDQAEIVRLIFQLRTVGDGSSGPIGVIQITEWLNSRGHRYRKGGPFYTSVVHRILSDETYVGRYYTHRHIAKTGRIRPKPEWVLTEVEPIISEVIFARTQALLASCRPYQNPPRFQNSEVLLGGICRCGSCGGPMIKRTGTGGNKVTYEYYHCSAAKLRGRSQCQAPARIRQDLLDRIVLKAVCEELLVPDRVAEIVDNICDLRETNADGDRASLKQLKRNRTQINSDISNLIRAVASGNLLPSESVRSHQEQLESELAKIELLIRAKEKIVQSHLKRLAPDDAEAFCQVLRSKLLGAPPKPKRRLVQALVGAVEVSSNGTTIDGSGDALADMSGSLNEADEIAASRVRSSVRKWRSGRDYSNAAKILISILFALQASGPFPHKGPHVKIAMDRDSLTANTSDEMACHRRR